MTILALAFSLFLADVPAPITAAVSRYIDAMQAVQAKRKGASVQKVFEAAVAARASLTIDAVKALDETGFASVEQSLPALRLQPDAAAAIDGAFFTELAGRRGTAADVDFFKAWTDAHPADATGCTQFSTLPDRYRAWFAFARKHKSAYKPLLIEEIVRTEDEIMKSTCACEAQDLVRLALAELARDYPTGKITQRVRQRIQDIDRGVSDIRLNCEP